MCIQHDVRTDLRLRAAQCTRSQIGLHLFKRRETAMNARTGQGNAGLPIP